MTLGKKLIKLRTDKKMSQKELAKELGVHVNTYAKWEHSSNNLSPEAVDKLVKLYGKDREFFMVDAVDMVVSLSDVYFELLNAMKKAEAPKKEPAVKQQEAQTAKINIELQYAGKAIPYADIVEKAKAAVGKKSADLNIYIKPEENRVYYVAGSNVGSFEI